MYIVYDYIYFISIINLYVKVYYDLFNIAPPDFLCSLCLIHYKVYRFARSAITTKCRLGV